MPQREAKFEVSARPEEVWRFIRDFQALCSCIPGVERLNVLDERTAELTVKEKVGVVPLIVNLRAQIDAEEPPRRLHAVATAEHLSMAIEVTLQATPSGTELTSLFDVKGTGQLKAIVDRLFEKRATERTAQFAESLGRRFGGAPPQSVPQPASGGWLRRLIGWLRRRLTSSS